MKLSISLPEEDVRALDAYAAQSGLDSRSAAIRKAIQMLRHPDLEQDYADAWDEWESTGEGAVWELASADGLPRAQG